MDNKPSPINWSFAIILMLISLFVFILLPIIPNWLLLVIGGFVIGIAVAMLIYSKRIAPDDSGQSPSNEANMSLYQRFINANPLRHTLKRINIRFAKLKEETSPPLRPPFDSGEQTDFPL